MLNRHKSSVKTVFRTNGEGFHNYRYSRIAGIVPYIQNRLFRIVYSCGPFLRFGAEIGMKKYTNFSFSKLISLAIVRNRSLQILIKMAQIDQKMDTDNQ